MSVKVTITHIEGPDKGEKETFVLSNGEEVSLGRTQDNTISFPAKEIVSRHHAKIVFEGDHFQIVNLNPSNKTYVNGDPVESQKLEQGDVIELARQGPKIRFQFAHAKENLSARYVILLGILLGTFLGILTFTLVYFLRRGK